MDLSSQHIEMVGAAEEIQKLMPDGKNQYFVSFLEKTKGETVYGELTPDKWVQGSYGDDVQFMSKDPKEYRWIPRFDQYQELAYKILGLGWILLFGGCAETYSQVCQAMGGKPMDISPEVIALMMIMGNGHGMAWNAQEKKWVKSSPASQIIRV